MNNFRRRVGKSEGIQIVFKNTSNKEISNVTYNAAGGTAYIYCRIYKDGVEISSSEYLTVYIQPSIFLASSYQNNYYLWIVRDPNYNTSDRTGTITVTYGDVSKSITVILLKEEETSTTVYHSKLNSIVGQYTSSPATIQFHNNLLMMQPKSVSYLNNKMEQYSLSTSYEFTKTTSGRLKVTAKLRSGYDGSSDIHNTALAVYMYWSDSSGWNSNNPDRFASLYTGLMLSDYANHPTESKYSPGAQSFIGGNTDKYNVHFVQNIRMSIPVNLPSNLKVGDYYIPEMEYVTLGTFECDVLNLDTTPTATLTYTFNYTS